MKKLLLLFLALFFICPIVGQDIKIFTEDLPPLNYKEDGEIKGPAVEIVQEIKKIIGEQSKIEFVPWARGYNKAKNEPNVALFSTTRTKEREDIFQWVGPLAHKKWVFFAHKDSKIEINSLEDAKKVDRVAVKLEDVNEQDLKNWGFVNIESSSNPIFNVKKLFNKRVDLWYTSEKSAADISKKAGINFNQFKNVFTAKKAQLYIAFSSGTPKETVEKWQKAYNELQARGKISEIFAKYNLEALAPE